MKKFFTLLLFASLMTAPNVFADGDDNNTGGNNGGNNSGNDGGNNGGDTQTPPTPPSDGPITFNPLDPTNPDPGKIKPRSLSAVSGWCANGTIQLYFSQDMGLVSVTVTNITTGNVWYSDAESSDGVIFIDIEPIAGCYTITIETQTAGAYYGEFML